MAADFLVAANPVLAHAIRTPMDGLDGGDVKIGDIPGYYAVPVKGGKRPGGAGGRRGLRPARVLEGRLLAHVERMRAGLLAWFKKHGVA